MLRIIRYDDTYKKSTIRHVSKILCEFNIFVNKKDFPDIYNITEAYQTNKGNFWIVPDDKRIIGSIGLMNMKKARGCLKRMYVIKSVRGKGLAQKLLQKLLYFSRKQGYKRIFLSTRHCMKRAMRFYERNGFRRIKSFPNDMPGYNDDVFYVKRL